MSHRWEGIFVALWTPTDEDGEILEGDLKANLGFLRHCGVQGILALGSTGEFPYLEIEQRKRILEMVLENSGSAPVLANVSDIRPRVVADLGRSARRAGAAGISVLPPHFFPFAQEDLAEFFIRASEAADLPLFLYNFPERTGNRISLETISAVADRAPLVAIKQSGAEFEYHRDLVQLGKEKGFVVFTGADTRLIEAMHLGVVGCVSGLGNVLPEYLLRLFYSFGDGSRASQESKRKMMMAGTHSSFAKGGYGGGGSAQVTFATIPASRASAAVVEMPSDEAADEPEVQVLTQRLTQVAGLLKGVSFPLHVAATMEARGLPVGAPKSLVSEQTKISYTQLVNSLRSLFQEWNLV